MTIPQATTDTTSPADGGASEDLRAAYRELLALYAPTLQFHGSDVAAGLALAVATLAKKFPALAGEGSHLCLSETKA